MIMIFDPSGGDGNALYLTGDVFLRFIEQLIASFTAGVGGRGA